MTPLWLPPPGWGNYMLREFVEIPWPDTVSLWPATSAWWWPLGLVLLIAATGTVRFLQYRRRNRYRREALAQLRRLQAANDLGAVPVLLKATALHAYGRPEVAALSGQAWLDFLTSKVATVSFGEALLQIDYLPEARWPGDQSDRLFTACATWIEQHPLPVPHQEIENPEPKIENA